MPPSITKKELFDFCNDFITERIDRLAKGIKNLEHSLLSETKSSAGDKHETGRAMIQLEREKLGKQLYEAEQLLQLLRKVDIHHHSKRAMLGSIVTTDNAVYFIAISAGKFSKHGKAVFCISANTPIGQQLLGKVPNTSFEFHNSAHKILSIV